MSDNNENINENLENKDIDTPSGNEDNDDNLQGNDENKDLENNDKNKIENENLGAPEQYDFKKYVPEGFEYNEDMAKKFEPIAKELNLSELGVEKMVNFYAQIQRDEMANMPEKMTQVKEHIKKTNIAEYEKLLNQDEEIGGGNLDKMNAYIDVADKGYNAFASDGLKEVLKSNGLDYHPEVIKFFHKLGALSGDDKMNLTGKPSNEMSAAQILYGNTEYKK